MNRRQFLLASTGGIVILAGCSNIDTDSGDNSPTSEDENERITNAEILGLISEAHSYITEASESMDDANVLVGNDQWENAAESYQDAADSYADAEVEINTAINKAEELDDQEMQDYLGDYQAYVRAGTSAATSYKQMCEAMIDGDRDLAQSHHDQGENYHEDMERYHNQVYD